ncbi:MAG: hypothetical protein FWG46_01835 [Treponema sp.]|nr:hypothetical protein [Treponema sp.]
MSIFCLLWIPAFCLFRRTAFAGRGAVYLWALLTGSVITLVQYYAGPMAVPGGFGFSRWLAGFIDIASLPAVVPLVVCILLIKLRMLPAGTDHAGFTLFSLIPLAAYRSISWNSPASPVLLVLVPLLWTAQAAGMPWFFRFTARGSRWYIVAPAILAIAALPAAAAASWWAFFSQHTLIAWLLLCVTFAPAVISGFKESYLKYLTQRH